MTNIDQLRWKLMQKDPFWPFWATLTLLWSNKIDYFMRNFAQKVAKAVREVPVIDTLLILLRCTIFDISRGYDIF